MTFRIDVDVTTVVLNRLFLPCAYIKSPTWEFSGSPVVRTLQFHCRGHGFDPWSGNQDLTCHVACQKKINKTQPEKTLKLATHLGENCVVDKIVCRPSRPLTPIAILVSFSLFSVVHHPLGISNLTE